MPSILKSPVKHKTAYQFKPVATISQAYMSLTLAISTWETILTSLTTQITQLRQQVAHNAEIKPHLCISKERDRKKVKWGKQTIHNGKKQPVLLSRDVATSQNTSRSIHEVCRRNARPANLFTHTIGVRHPRETTVQLAELVTQKRRTETPNPTQSQHKEQITVKEWPGTDRACQTDKIMESRGVNTTLKTNLNHVSPAPHGKKKLKQLFKTSDMVNDVEGQEHIKLKEGSVQDIDANTKVEEVLFKIPESSSDLLFYTNQKIEQLKDSGKIQLPEKKRDSCVFCREDGHNVSECETLRRISKNRGSANPLHCGVCQDQHTLVNCGWIQIIDLTVSLTQADQAHLVKECPFLKKFTDTPKGGIIYSMYWSCVEDMDTTQFKYHPFVSNKETKEKKRIDSIQEQDTMKKPEKMLIKIPTNSDQLAFYTEQKINELISKNELCIPKSKINFCVFCRNDKHNVTECTVMKKNSEEKYKKKEKCMMCESSHELRTCKWLQLLDTAHSLTTDDQQKLCNVCPFFQSSVENPVKWVLFNYRWELLKPVVETMDSSNFHFPYFKKPKHQSQPQSIETPNKKIITQKNLQDKKLCYFCHSKEHFIRSCDLHKQAKIKRKNRRNENTRAKFILQ